MSLDRMSQAVRLHKDGHLDEAGALYAAILQQDPVNLDALHCAGVLLLQTGALEDAAVLFVRAVEVQPDNAPVLCNLGLALMRLGRDDEAADALTRSVTLASEEAKSRVLLGSLLVKQGRLHEAEPHLNKAVALAPGDEDARTAWENFHTLQRHLKQQQGERVLLLPEDLYRDRPLPFKMAILGACIAEHLVTACQRHGYVADHYLMRCPKNDPVPQVRWGNYDVVVVHLALRFLILQLHERLDYFLVNHISDEEYDRVLSEAKALIERRIADVNEAVGDEAQIFYLSFVETPSTHQGILLNNRRKSLYHFIRSLNDSMAGMLENRRNAHYIELNDLVRYHGDAAVTDTYEYHSTHAFITHQRGYDSVFKRIVHAMSVLRAEAPIKLIVTDLDNTLWDGVLADMDEVNPERLWGRPPLGYGEALLEFRRRGGLLAISSKNDYEPTVEGFRKLWGKQLRIEDFCSIKINWEPKSKAIREILQETNILPQNVLFIDDNPREIEEVTRVFPEIRTLSGDKITAWRHVILYSPQTQVARISDESATRTEMIQAKRERDHLAEQMDRDAYLRSLELTIQFDDITTADHPKFARAAELINKTNQFNTTGKRWSEADFGTYFSAGGRLMIASVSDRFTDNGLIAVAALKEHEMSQMVVSCRVFGLGVEDALVHRIQASRAGVPLFIPFVATGKNKTCELFLEQSVFSKDEAGFSLARPIGHPDWVRVVAAA